MEPRNNIRQGKRAKIEEKSVLNISSLDKKNHIILPTSDYLLSSKEKTNLLVLFTKGK
jgi:hypothetical protein